MDGNWITTEAEADEFLSRHSAAWLTFRKVRGGWVAEIKGSRERPLPHGPMPLEYLRLTLATRYLAQSYGNAAHVNLAWAKHMPNWVGDLGALPEIAAAILRAEQATASV